MLRHENLGDVKWRGQVRWAVLLLMVTVLSFTVTPEVFSAAVVDGDSGASVLPPDVTYIERQNDALINLAQKFMFRSYGPADMVTFGFDTTFLVAKFALYDRGLPGGLSPSSPEAIKFITNFAEHALQNLGTRTSDGPWSWGSAGSPAVMHGAMSFGYIIHQWGSVLPSETVELITRTLSETSWWRETIDTYFVNGRFGITAGMLLAGEYLGYDSDLWKRGADHFTGLFRNAMIGGTIEMNAPTYSLYHIPPLMLLQELNHEVVRSQARCLLDFELLVGGHLYLPGGGLGAPQSRDYGGGAKDSSSLPTLYSLLFDDPEVSYAGISTAHAIGVASSYVPYSVLRSVFLDKGEGYTMWAYSDAPVGRSRLGNGYYRLGPDRRDVAPWQAVVMPGGEAMMGFSYGMRYQSIHVSQGVYVKDPNGNFQILYHYQPWIDGDRSQTGNGLPSTNGDINPDDFIREGYERERMIYGRTLLQIWDPQSTRYEDTRVHLPNWDRYGGEMVKADDWYVGQMGENYIAFRPLGVPEVVEERAGGTWTYMRLLGRSGSIIELANTAQFATIGDYVADLKNRYLKFETGSPYYVEFDALDPETGEKARIKLQYSPERRFVNNEEVSMEELDLGLLSSSFVSWDPSTYAMTLSRTGYDTITYDWDDGVVTVGGEEGPRVVFNNLSYGQVLRQDTLLGVSLEEFAPTEVTVKLNGVVIFNGSTVPSVGEITLEPRKLAEGSQLIEVQAKGSSGQEIEKALVFSVPAKVTITAPTHGSVERGEMLVRLGLENLELDHLLVQVDDEDIYSGDSVSDHLLLDTLNLSEGPHILHVVARDVYGHTLERDVSFAVDNWTTSTDPLDPPLESPFFGVIDRSRTSTASSGWSYADSGIELFGDDSRRVRQADTDEYLIWETPGLADFELVIYATKIDITGFVRVAVSPDQDSWWEVPFDVDLVESLSNGWSKLRITGEVKSGLAANWLRLTFGNYSPASELQLGQMSSTIRK